MERNRYLLMLTFYPTYFLILIALPCLLMDIGMLFFSIIHGWFASERKIYSYFIKQQNYVKIYQTRKMIKKFQVVKFSNLARHFSGRIEFKEISNPILSYLVNPLLSLYWSLIKRFI